MLKEEERTTITIAVNQEEATDHLEIISLRISLLEAEEVLQWSAVEEEEEISEEAMTVAMIKNKSSQL